MVKAEVLDFVLRRVDPLLRVVKVRFDHKRGRVAVSAGRRVIRASVAALCQHERNVAVLRTLVCQKCRRGEMTYIGYNGFDKLRKSLVDKIGDDTHGLRPTGIQRALHIPRHVLLKHGLDISVVLSVLRKHSLGAEQPAFFRRVPVELDRVAGIALRNVLGLQEDAHGLQSGDRAAPIVVCTWSRQDRWKEQVDAVLVRSNDNGPVAPSGDRRDDGELAPGMVEFLDRGPELGRSGIVNGLLDLLVQPDGRLDAVLRLVVAGVERGEFDEMLAHVVLGQLLGKRLDDINMTQFRRELNHLASEERWVYPFVSLCRDIEEIPAILGESISAAR